MKLKILIKEIKVKKVIGSSEIEILHLTLDSKKVEINSLFFAVKGKKTDGHSHIDEALKNGATAVICEKLPDELNKKITYIQVESTQKVIGPIASTFWNHPSKKLKIIGVTGTNGKTTITSLLHQLFELAGKPSGLIGTIENRIHQKKIKATHTTPDAISLNKLLNEMVQKKCLYVFMEVSSHAIDQGRINGIKFVAGVFTNLTHEHLDYHLTMDKYLEAKKKFFDSLPPLAFVLANKDDEHCGAILKNVSAQSYTYAISQKADFNAQILDMNLTGTNIQIDNQKIKTNLIGLFNVYNLLAVYAASLLLGLQKKKVLNLLSKLSPVEGRLELIRGDILGIVDYAHTPDALKKVLETVNNLKSTNQKSVCVVGCGGDRDSKKRPIMAGIAFDLAQIVILTSDNPRSENPQKIIKEMQCGLRGKSRNKIFKIPDRRKAILEAVKLAGPNGVVIVTGKGHERYQEIAGKKYPFDDVQILSEAIKLN